jgi:predicted transcriptional regulator
MMHIHTAKQDAIAAIQRLPDTADMEEIMYRLYVLENIRRGQEDATQGKTVPAEQVLKDLQTW